jgi:hypothetical protein
MKRNHPKCPDSDDPDQWELPNVVVREAPDEEEDEEEDEGDGKEDNDDEGADDGHSE